MYTMHALFIKNHLKKKIDILNGKPSWNQYGRNWAE